MSNSVVRLVFAVLSVVLATAFTTTNWELGWISLSAGIAAGVVIAGVGLTLEKWLQRCDLRAFNTTTLALFFGYMMGQGLTLVIDGAIGQAAITNNASLVGAIHAITFLLTTFIALILTARASESLFLSLPFVKLKPTAAKKKDILIDSSILLDARIIDVAATGVFNSQLILPRFIVAKLHDILEQEDEGQHGKARRGLEVLKKLEALPDLDMRYTDSDEPEVKDPTQRMVRLARLLDARILSADISRVQQASFEGVVVINIHSLSNALKPLMAAGETIDIKVQRYGKEPRQGVGYLEDGTMVVINGGGSFIGQVIKGHVLSVKHTSSGRMIFCNAADADGTVLPDVDSGNIRQDRPLSHEKREPVAAGSGSPRDYFVV